MVTTVIVVIAAILVVFGTSVIKNIEWSDKNKQLVAVGLSILAGAASVFAMGGFVGVNDVLQAATLVYGAAQAVYQFIFKGTSLNEKLSAWSVGSKPEVEVPEPVEEDVTADPELVEVGGSDDAEVWAEDETSAQSPTE